jgi:hypothetical protein
VCARHLFGVGLQDSHHLRKGCEHYAFGGGGTRLPPGSCEQEDTNIWALALTPDQGDMDQTRAGVIVAQEGHTAPI